MAQKPAAAEFSGVIVGEIVEAEQHPDADKLNYLPGLTMVRSKFR